MLEPKVFGDDRGYFVEVYNEEWMHTKNDLLY